MKNELVISGPKEVGMVLKDTLSGLDHEECWCLFLTCANTVISVDMLSKGTLIATSIDCRTVMRQSLLHNAASLILVHNHPSGRPNPSKKDILFTRKLEQACRLMDIKFLDHIIVSDNRFFSFAEERTGAFS